MASVIEICNQALQHIRGGSINSLDEGSVQAQVCKLFYDTARDQLLTEVPWGFSHAIEPLAQLTEVTVFNWAYVWLYPTDCLHINRCIRNLQHTPAGDGTRWFPGMRAEEMIVEDMPAVEYQVAYADDQRVITTREPEVRIDYRRRVEDPNLYPADFRIALSFLLGSYLAVPIIGVRDGAAMKRECIMQYEMYRAKASANAGNEQQRSRSRSKYTQVWR